MNWAEFKKLVENAGVDDDTEIGTIEVDYPTKENIKIRKNISDNILEVIDY